MMFIIVDLPEPDVPMIAIDAPRSMTRSTPRSAWTRLSPITYVRWIPRMSISAGRDATTGASGGGMRNLGDKKPVWKLVDGRPKMALIKTGLTDGSSTQMLEGDLQPGDQLITEVQGLPTQTRKIGAF